MQHLLAAQVHLGHSVDTWHPAMNPFIYGNRNGIHIINLDHTLTHLRRAINITREVSLRGGNILFVGSKPILHRIVVQAAYQGNAYFATRWIGGLLTNKERILRRSVGYDPDKVVQENKAFGDVLGTSEDGTELVLPTLLKSQPFVHSPDLVILLDYVNNSWAAREANYAGVPVIAVCDTDCDPSKVQYPIPANDDSSASLSLIAGVLSRASKEGFDKRESLRKTCDVQE
jgi:small subunit ribosomal protein S2